MLAVVIINKLPTGITIVIKEEINKMSEYEKLEWIHYAIQEAINGNTDELTKALEFVEDIREKHFKK